MNKSQQKVYDKLCAFANEKGYMPTRSELAKELDCYPNNVHEHLKSLQEDGYIELIPKISRGIRVLE